MRYLRVMAAAHDDRIQDDETQTVQTAPSHDGEEPFDASRDGAKSPDAEAQNVLPVDACTEVVGVSALRGRHPTTRKDHEPDP